jgi:hypothetical protein
MFHNPTIPFAPPSIFCRMPVRRSICGKTIGTGDDVATPEVLEICVTFRNPAMEQS